MVIATDENIRDILLNYLEGNSEDYEPIGEWDTSQVTDMSHLFDTGMPLDNNGENIRDINNWDVSNVTNMSNMFYRSEFNKPLDRWNVSNVEDMSRMFYRSKFNQPLNSWNVSNVVDMNHMFTHNDKFNQPLNKWDLSSVGDMNHMFYGATAFNQDLRGWLNTLYKEYPNYDPKYHDKRNTNMEGMLADTPAMSQAFRINKEMVKQRPREINAVIDNSIPILYQGFTAEKSATNQRPPLPAYISSKIMGYVDTLPVDTIKMATKGEDYSSRKQKQNKTAKEDIHRGGKRTKRKTKTRKSKCRSRSRSISRSRSRCGRKKYIIR